MTVQTFDSTKCARCKSEFNMPGPSKAKRLSGCFLNSLHVQFVQSLNAS